MLSLKRSFSEKRTWWGKASVAVFALILLLGGVPAIIGFVSPSLPADDCMAAPFVAAGDNSQFYIWYKAMSAWRHLFQALFLIAVAVHGHSTASCLLFVFAPTSNVLFWTLSMKKDVMSASDGSAIMDCWSHFLYQIILFWVLTIIALGGSIVDDWYAHRQGYAATPDVNE